MQIVYLRSCFKISIFTVTVTLNKLKASIATSFSKPEERNLTFNAYKPNEHFVSRQKVICYQAVKHLFHLVTFSSLLVLAAHKTSLIISKNE